MAVKILMVCLGNICRSPLAEGILANKLSGKDFLIDSAGTGDWHVGELPDRRSVAIAKENNIDITYQRARHFTVKDFDLFDYIYVMDKSNYDTVSKIAPSVKAQKKVKMILEELYPGKKKNVPDPYYGSPDDFRKVYLLLDKACTVIANSFLQHHHTP